MNESSSFFFQRIKHFPRFFVCCHAVVVVAVVVVAVVSLIPIKNVVQSYQAYPFAGGNIVVFQQKKLF